jgi:hypothetical protein
MHVNTARELDCMWGGQKLLGHLRILVIAIAAFGAWDGLSYAAPSGQGRNAPPPPVGSDDPHGADLNEGKSIAEIFNAGCGACHKSPHGLAKDSNTTSLTNFLRQHYTTGAPQAAALANYLATSAREGKPAREPVATPARTNPAERSPAIGARRAPKGEEGNTPEEAVTPPAAIPGQHRKPARVEQADKLREEKRKERKTLHGRPLPSSQTHEAVAPTEEGKPSATKRQANKPREAAKPASEGVKPTPEHVRAPVQEAAKPAKPSEAETPSAPEEKTAAPVAPAGTEKQQAGAAPGAAETVSAPETPKAVAPSVSAASPQPEPKPVEKKPEAPEIPL